MDRGLLPDCGAQTLLQYAPHVIALCNGDQAGRGMIILSRSQNEDI